MITDPTVPGVPDGVVEAKLVSGIDDHSRYSVIAVVQKVLSWRGEPPMALH